MFNSVHRFNSNFKHLNLSLEKSFLIECHFYFRAIGIILNIKINLNLPKCHFIEEYFKIDYQTMSAMIRYNLESEIINKVLNRFCHLQIYSKKRRLSFQNLFLWNTKFHFIEYKKYSIELCFAPSWNSNTFEGLNKFLAYYSVQKTQQKRN